MSNPISSVSQANPYPSLSIQTGGSSDKGESSISPQVATPQADDSVTFSQSAQFHAAFQRAGLKLTTGTLGQLFAPAFFASADSSGDARLSPSEFASFIEQSGGTASQAASLYREMGGGDNGLSYAQFREGAGQGEAKDFFNNLVMERIKGSDSDPAKWIERLRELGDESDAASSRIANELDG